MPIKPPIIIAAISSVGLLLLITIVILFQQLNQLTVQVKQLQTPTDYASQAYVNSQLEAKYKPLNNALNQAMHMSAMQSNELTQQIANTHGLVLSLVEDVQGGIAHDSRILDQIDSTHATVNSVLSTLERNEQRLQRLLPTGTVITYAGQWNNKIRTQFKQNGWLLCDGSRLKREEYPQLYQVIGTLYGKGKRFQLPDFRGVFLRGLDLGRKLDPQRRLGRYQKDANRRHSHEGISSAAKAHQHSARSDFSGQHTHGLNADIGRSSEGSGRRRLAITGSVNEYRPDTDEAGGHRHQIQVQPAGEHRHTLELKASGSAESRPKNYPVVYLIRY